MFITVFLFSSRLIDDNDDDDLDSKSFLYPSITILSMSFSFRSHGQHHNDDDVDGKPLVDPSIISTFISFSLRFARR